jgi:undecaprenyl-diphosphatase
MIRPLNIVLPRITVTTLVRELAVVGSLAATFTGLLLALDHTSPTPFDLWLAGIAQSVPWGELAIIPRLGSDLGGGVYGFYVLPAVAAIAFAATRRWRLLILLAAVYALHYALISPKLFVLAYRPSPLFGVEGAGGLESFPSGHVQWAVSFYGLLAVLAWRAASARLRIAVIAVYAAVVLATMLGRIELGRHWPLDTFAGLVAGLIALRVIMVLYAWPRVSPRAAPVNA